MKKVFSKLAVLLMIAGMLAGCANNGGGDSGTDSSSTTKSIKICLTGADASKTWNIWAWKEKGSTDENYSSKAWPGGDIQLTEKDSVNGYIYTTMTVDISYPLGILFVDTTKSAQTSDTVVPISDLKAFDTLYFIFGDTSYYTSIEDISGIKSAKITSADGNSLSATVYNASDVSPSDFIIKNVDETSLTVSSAVISGTAVSITLSDGNIAKAPYTVTYAGVSVTASMTSDVIDSAFTYTGNDLGWNGTDTVKLWAPAASKVILNLYTGQSDSTPASTVNMIRGDKGVWSAAGVSSGSYYDFTVTNAGVAKNVLDPYAKAMASFDSTTEDGAGRGFLYDSSKMGSVATGPVTLTQREDAVIYEVSVRDFTISPDSGVTSPGTYAGFKEKLDYLKTLGVTHIELLPVLNFYYGDESSRTYEGVSGSKGTASGNNYNWGYDPHNYFTPEGWYSSDSSDPYARITELKSLINAAHADGMGIILDVVYNHMAKASLLNDIVPDYYFRETSSGSLTSNSGCGNDTATEHAMMAKLLEDSVEYWTKEYKVDGFRFDLMGLLDADAVETAYSKPKAVNSSVLFIGEGWNYSVSNVTLMNQKYMTSTDDCAVFNDNIRDLCKQGGMSEGTGFISGAYSTDITRLYNNIIGATDKTSDGDTYTADDPGDNVQYLVCHDGLTLHDSIAYNMNTINEAKISPRVKIGNFICLTSQGIAFLHAGQERGRTKPKYQATTECKGSYISNSYDSSDSINQIVWTLDATYQNIQAYTQGLIALRKKESVFRLGTASAVSAAAAQITTGNTQVMAYSLKDGSSTWLIFMNASTSKTTISTGVTGSYVVYVDGSTAGTTGVSSPSGVSYSGSDVTLDPLTCAVIKVD